MFFRKSKTELPSFQKDPVGFLLWQIDGDLQILSNAIPQNLEASRFELAAHNADKALRHVVERFALELRRSENKMRAPSNLDAAALYVNWLLDAIYGAKAQNSASTHFVHLSNLKHGFLATILSDRWEWCEKLAIASTLPIMVEEGLVSGQGNIDDAFCQLLAAAILNDNSSFDVHFERYQEVRKLDRFFQKYFNYDALLLHLMSGNALQFDACLRELEERFRLRATDKKVNHEQTLDACGPNNALVVDVWSLAFINLARQKGMTTVG